MIPFAGLIDQISSSANHATIFALTSSSIQTTSGVAEFYYFCHFSLGQRLVMNLSHVNVHMFTGCMITIMNVKNTKPCLITGYRSYMRVNLLLFTMFQSSSFWGSFLLSKLGIQDAFQITWRVQIKCLGKIPTAQQTLWREMER